MKALRHRSAARRASSRGASLLEFAFIAMALMVVLLTGLEIDRMGFVYANLADAAKAGVRYAIVHGSDRTGTGVDGPSSSANSSQVVQAVKNYVAGVDLSAVNVAVTYPDTTNIPGSRVQIVVTYSYSPFTGFGLLNGISLSAKSQGVIAF